MLLVSISVTKDTMIKIPIFISKNRDHDKIVSGFNPFIVNRAHGLLVVPSSDPAVKFPPEVFVPSVSAPS